MIKNIDLRVIKVKPSSFNFKSCFDFSLIFFIVPETDDVEEEENDDEET